MIEALIAGEKGQGRPPGRSSREGFPGELAVDAAIAEIDREVEAGWSGVRRQRC